MIRFVFFSICLCAWIQSFSQVSDFASINFRKADSIAALYANHSVDDLYMLSLKLTSDLDTEPEKFRAIYKWVADNIENDYHLFAKNREKRKNLKDPEALAEWNAELTQLVLRNLRKHRRTVCTGYAFLLKELSAQAGIRCQIVNGYGRTSTANVGGEGGLNHSWNAVYLQGKWYLCDATWSSGAIDLERKAFVKNYDDTYFLPEPELFVRNHYPQDTAWVLTTSKPTLAEFLNRPLFYVRALTFGISDLQPDDFNVIAKRGTPLRIEFVSAVQDIVTATVQETRAGKLTEFTVPVQRTPNGAYAFAHTFNTTGVHVVQVKLKDEYVFCYRVAVEK